ncbi:MAG: hypothetical protein KKC46_23005, partial [Proteobacteria bacterium]|nr:hypothetical protein [Pseudomonadota bacterium]
MKRFLPTIFITVTILVVGVVLNPTVLFAGSPEGYHDANYNSSCQASGWAVDPDDKSQDVNVRLLENGKVLASGLANRHRNDLTQVCPN